MKRLSQIRRTEGIKINDATVHGGYGTVSINGWKGSVVWGADEGGWEHVSVSPLDGHTPTWDEMCILKDMFWHDDEEVIQFHPKKAHYVNMKDNCLHLWRKIEGMITPMSDPIYQGEVIIENRLSNNRK